MRFITKYPQLICILYCLYFLSTEVTAACPNLTLNFANINQSGCGVPQLVTFDNTSTGTNANNTTTYFWRINGVLVDSTLNTAPHFTYSFLAPGTYTVRLIARTTGNCRDSIQQNITITSAAPAVYNGASALSFNPVWNNCILNPLQSNSYTINIASNVILNNYTIIWGDATANATGASLAVGNSIAHTYTALGQYLVKIVTQNGSCFDTLNGTVYNMRPVSTSIKPLPAGQLAGCAPHTITFQDSTQNALPGTVLTWTFGDGTIVIRDWTQANKPISHTYLPVGNGSCVYTVSLSAFNPNCNTGPTNASTYTISPILIFDKDVAQINPPSNLCLPSLTYTFGNSSQDNCITGQRYYYWSFGDGTNTGWITSKGPQTHTFPSLGSYTIMLIDSNGCGTDTTYTTVVINTPPQVGFTLTPKYGCAPFALQLGDTSLGIGNSRVWTLVGATPNNSTAGIVNPVYTLPGTYIVKLTIGNPCAANVTKTDTIRVYAKPAVQIGNAVSGCVPHTLQLQNNTANQSTTASYYWDFGNGQTSTQKIPPPITYNTTGSFNIKLVVTDTCGKDSQQVTIAVSTKPTAAFSATTVCKTQATTFTSSSSVATGDVITNYKWYYGNGDSTAIGSSPQNYTYVNSGTFNAVLQITTDKNCIDRDTLAITVKATPTVGITNTPNTICDGNLVLFDGVANTTAPSTITQYRWTFGTSDTLRVEDTTYRFPNTGVYNVQFLAVNNVGCSATVSKNVTVNPNPDARLFRTIACNNQFTQFKDSSIVIGSGNSINQWGWDFTGDGIIDSTSQHPRFKFTTPGIYKTKLTVTTNNGCSNTDSLTTTVNFTPIVNFSPVSNSLCLNDTFTFNNTSIGAFAFGWDMGDNTGEYFETTNTPFKYIYPDTGMHNVKLTGYSLQGCRDSAYAIVYVRPLPKANFTVNDTVGCAPKNFSFSNTSILANGYKWLIGNTTTTTLTNRTDTLISLSAQIVQVKLVATNQYNCTPDTAVKTLYTFSNPTPNFTISKDSGCGPLPVVFTNTTPNGLSYTWQLGNGNTAATLNAASTYMASLNNDSIYSIKLIASNGPGCTDSITKTVRVFPKPSSNFNPVTTSGCAPLAVSFSNSSTHNYGGNIANMSFNWDFGNNTTSTQQNTVATYTASLTKDTVYNIKLIAYSKFGCSDTSSKSITVFPNPKAHFLTTNAQGCGPLYTSFINQSIPNDTGTIAIMSFNWIFGNGFTSTQINPNSTYTASKVKDSIYSVKLIAISEHSCRDTALQNIQVFPNPNASFVKSSSSGCAPLGVNFTNTSTPNDTGTINMMSFLWQLGNGNTTLSQDASTNYVANIFTDTTYTIKLKAISEHGCLDSTLQQVVVHPKPITAFTQNKNSGCGPLNVQFTNQTQLANKYYWNFGDGDTSTSSNPSHLFNSYYIYDSVYPVRLSAQSQYGCLGDTVSTLIIARYKPIADFFALQDSICGTGNIAFFNASLGGIQSLWNFGNNQNSTAINPVSSFNGLANKDTTYAIKLIVNSPYGCRDTAIKTVKINAYPIAQFNNVVANCTPYQVNFTNSSVRGVKYHWDFGDATTDTVFNPSKVFANNFALINRTYPVSLTVTSAGGCIATASQNVVVYPLPTVSITATKSQRCDTAEFNFLNATQGASNYFWNFGDGLNSTLITPKHFYNSHPLKDTTYQIKLIATTSFGCKDSVQTAAVVHPLVKANFTANTTQSCQNLDVQFQNQSNNAVNYFWLFGDGGGTTITNPNHSYANVGNYNIKLIAYDQYGCTDTVQKPAYINIYEIPKALFTYSPFAPQLPNTLVNFTDRSYLSSGTLNYNWHFGDILSTSNTSTNQHPSHIYTDSGNYTVKQIVTSNFGCTDTFENTIYVHPRKPIPSFDIDVSEGCKPLTVTFTNTSTYGDSYEWDFGDGNGSTEKDPTHTYTRDDIYTVKLKVFGPGGDSVLVKQQLLTVHDLPRARFTVNPAMVYLPNAHSTFTNTSFDVNKSKWFVYDSILSEIFTDTNFHSGFDFKRSGEYSVKLIVYNQYNCTDTFYLPNSITVDLHGIVTIPNAFTPNGDGKNETFKPVVSGVKNEGYMLKIYDRWGMLIFETTNPYEAWNGEVNGAPAVSDVYIWLLEGFFATNERFTKKGQVTLLR